MTTLIGLGILLMLLCINDAANNGIGDSNSLGIIVGFIYTNIWLIVYFVCRAIEAN